MSSVARARALLAANGVRFAPEIRVVETEDGSLHLFVPEARIGPRATKAKVSPRQMKVLAKRVADTLGVGVEWTTLLERSLEALEEAIESLYSVRFPGCVAHALLSSLSNHPAVLWVQPVQDAPEVSEEDLREAALPVLSQFGVDDLEVLKSRATRELTSPAVLRRTKALAPVKIRQLEAALAADGFELRSVRQVANILDQLRKKGLIVRSDSGHFALTQMGLSAVPHGLRRSSSDVERVLALGRRRW